jgi:superfamily II DNA or RNA helicase
MSVLAEGFDCPQLQTVFVRDTGTKTPAMQMGGRVLRLWKGQVKNIVQSDKADYPFSLFADPAEQFIRKSNQWYGISKSDLLERTVRQVRHLQIEMREEMAKNFKVPELPTEDVIEKFLFAGRGRGGLVLRHNG